MHESDKLNTEQVIELAQQTLIGIANEIANKSEVKHSIEWHVGACQSDLKKLLRVGEL